MKDLFYKISNKTYYIIVAILIIIILCLLLFTNILDKKSNNQVAKIEESLILFGDTYISINANEKYQEPGFYAISKDGYVDTDKVIVSGNDFDFNTPGLYVITYTYNNITKSRTIAVLQSNPKPEEQKEPSTNIENNIRFNLIGNITITIDENETYLEPGFTAYYLESDITKNVTVKSNLKPKVGTYTINYTLDYQGIKKELTRTIIVENNTLNISLTKSPNDYSKEVTISINITGSSFLYLTLPDKKVVNTNASSYKVNTNGTYTFIAYNKNGKTFQKSITINNIDNSPPTGTCSAIINTNNTIINVSASDNFSGIKSYIYKDDGSIITSSTNNSFTYNKKTSKNVSVQITDKANNQATITCGVTDKSYYPVIKPASSEKIVKQSETETLKVYITKKDEYYLTRIWVLDPYSQMNKQDSPKYGSELYTPKVLLENAVQENKLENKLIVGFNASGFYLKNTYDAESVRQYSKYDKTSVGSIVITNGKVIRNAYNKAVKTWFITGVNKNNEFLVFKDEKATTTDEINAKQKWSSTVINSGIRNTFTFASPIIQNGKETNITTSMPDSTNNTKKGLQLICQINANNFVLFTSKNETRNKGIKLFLNLGCQTAMNYDGGGSVALLFKDKNSSTFDVILGNGRKLPEAGYFREA